MAFYYRDSNAPFLVPLVLVVVALLFFLVNQGIIKVGTDTGPVERAGEKIDSSLEQLEVSADSLNHSAEKGLAKVRRGLVAAKESMEEGANKLLAPRPGAEDGKASEGARE